MSMRHKLSIGDNAPDFTLPDQDGELHTLSRYRGRWVLLYFYPKDDTPGCTKEACSIRDRFPDFKKCKITALGVSIDSVKSHKNFAGKYALPFTLLSDEDKKIVRRYGVWAEKKIMGRVYMGTARTSFLIDPRGKIVKIYKKVQPEVHGEEVVRDVKAMLR